ncbi:EF-hand domain-containing protein [Rhodobacteraceae bacterium F11138]|nr:EF-hand domain-containing protein [Rhodobacteraceae bacterium F11138]
MKHTGFITAVVAGAVSLAAFAAAAQGPGAHPSHRLSFQTLDANGDGEISREEMSAHREARFHDMDADGDGALSRDEMLAAARKRAGERTDAMLKRFDSNGDGMLSMDEMAAPRNEGKMFDRADRDGNGTVSQAEFDAARDRMKHHKKRHSDKS